MTKKETVNTTYKANNILSPKLHNTNKTEKRKIDNVDELGFQNIKKFKFFNPPENRIDNKIDNSSIIKVNKNDKAKKRKMDNNNDDNHVPAKISRKNSSANQIVTNINSNNKNRLTEINQNQKKPVQKKQRPVTTKSNITSHSFYGKMNEKCIYRGAVYWKQEKNKSNCCRNGNIKLPVLSKYDEDLKNLLLTNSVFRHLIRYYNNLFCFATFCANFEHVQYQAIYNLKLQGQVCHTTPKSLYPKDEKKTSL
ncbi:hypothetical protein TKK_0004628 [Trichogramma kaykai]